MRWFVEAVLIVMVMVMVMNVSLLCGLSPYSRGDVSTESPPEPEPAHVNHDALSVGSQSGVRRQDGSRVPSTMQTAPCPRAAV